MSQHSMAAVGLAILIPMAGTVAATLQTGDDLRLELSAEGAVTSLAIGPTVLPLKGPGGFAVADFKSQPEPANLVPNPGFEDGTNGWTFEAGQALDMNIVHSGKVSVRLEVPGPEPKSSNLGVMVPVKPSTRYRVGLWVRREKVGVCGAYSSERDDRGGLTGKQSQTGPGIPKKDGEWLPLAWEITTQSATTRLSLRADIYKSTGTLWLDDFFVHELNEGVYEPVRGQVSGDAGRLAFRGAMPARGLELEATLAGDAECIRIDGVIRDTTGQDRAVGVKFALPLDLAGWTWYTDAEEREPIVPGPVQRFTYNCVSGIGVNSVYPWSALSGPDVGLSLALPVAQGPCVFVIQHDQRLPETAIVFYFGLAKDAGNNPSRAPFSFVLYRHDPAWGMRAAMARYYRLFAESFVKRPTYEGYLNYANLERFDPATHQLVVAQARFDDASDFGEGYNFLWHIHGCYDYRQVPYADPKLPADETVFALLRDMVEVEKTKPKWYTPSAETIKKIVFGPKGQISYIGDTKYWRPHEGYNHTDQAGWGFNFRVNEDPGVSSFLADMARTKAEEYAKKPDHRPWDSMFTADAIEGYGANSSCLDFRREHFATTAAPLTFGHDTLAPAMPNTIWDFLRKSWWPLTTEYKILVHGNANSYEQFFTMPLIDVPMTEWDWDPQHPGRLDRFMRAIAYRKIWRHWHAWAPGGQYGDSDPANVRRQLRRSLPYTVYPPVYCIPEEHGDLGQSRALFRQYVPAMEEMAMAGWDPVPYARATAGAVVERYGTYAAGELHLVLRNHSEQPVDTTLTIEREALGIPADAELLWLDILPRTPQLAAFAPAGLPVRLEGDGVLALWVGSRAQAAQHGFRLAVATLEKLERMFQTEMDATARATWVQALDAARNGTVAQAGADLALAESLHQAAERLGVELKTKSPVDLAKLLFRLRADLSLVPVATLGLTASSSRLIEECPRGDKTSVAFTLKAPGAAGAANLTATVVSPWPEIAAQCAVDPATANLAPGADLGLRAQLHIPAEPPRLLMPYLVVVAGQTQAPDAKRFTIALPVDLQAGVPLDVTVSPERAFRGQTRHLKLTVANRLATAGQLSVKFGATKTAKMVPVEMSVAVPAQGSAEFAVDLVLEQATPIGGLSIPYSIGSADQRFAMQGALTVSVSDPVPQLGIRRTAAPPTIDGNLAEPDWQAAPLIPELHLLANGDPATEKTAVWTVYDDKGIYVAMRCSESQMDKLVAKYSERGSPLYMDDDVELFIQTPGGKMVRQFAINSLGAQSDNFGNKSDWKAAAQRADKSWTVEVFIPYSALEIAGPPGAGLAWGMQFGRQQKAKGETTSWTPGQAFIAKEGFGEILFE